jgi:hypothetical protein
MYEGEAAFETQENRFAPVVEVVLRFVALCVKQCFCMVETTGLDEQVEIMIDTPIQATVGYLCQRWSFEGEGTDAMGFEQA